MSRIGRVERVTGETEVLVELELDGSGAVDAQTGVGFFDHMLHQLGKHSGFDLTARVAGDLHVDAHHTMEDTAIGLGQALDRALGNRAGVRRFADAAVPLDEVSARAVVDLSGRPYCVHVEPQNLADRIGADYPTSMTRHVVESLAFNARITLHLEVLRASNPGQRPDAHHVVEAQFKALARALGAAAAVEGDVVPSTKGVL